MAWAIITIYTSKFVKMDPQQLPKTSRFYSRCKMCDIKKTVGGGYHTRPLVAWRLSQRMDLVVYYLQYELKVNLSWYTYRARYVCG